MSSISYSTITCPDKPPVRTALGYRIAQDCAFKFLSAHICDGFVSKHRAWSRLLFSRKDNWSLCFIHHTSLFSLHIVIMYWRKRKADVRTDRKRRLNSCFQSRTHAIIVLESSGWWIYHLAPFHKIRSLCYLEVWTMLWHLIDCQLPWWLLMSRKL